VKIGSKRMPKLMQNTGREGAERRPPKNVTVSHHKPPPHRVGRR